jgi:hypothetical protein
MVAGSVHPADLLTLDSLEIGALSTTDRLAYLAALDRVEAHVASRRADLLVAIAGEVASPSSITESHVHAEVALARRVGEGAATSSIELARALAVSFPGFAAALRAGELSEWHCRELVRATRAITDPAVLAGVESRVLPKARRLTPSRLRSALQYAIAALDPDATVRRESARADRYVSCRPLPDGMGFLGLVHDWGTVSAMHAAITADAAALRTTRGAAAAVRDGDDDARSGACQADAFAARVLGAIADDGNLTWDRCEQTVSLSLVIDLETLRGEADRPALLDGEPVPASAGRELAGSATRWRRAVTEPVTGHLLDYGTEQYLPAALRRYILARDHYCRVPGCTTRASSRLEVDHATPYPAAPPRAPTPALCACATTSSRPPEHSTSPTAPPTDRSP